MRTPQEAVTDSTCTSHVDTTFRPVAGSVSLKKQQPISMPHWLNFICLSHWTFLLTIGLAGNLVPPGRQVGSMAKAAPESVEIKIENVEKVPFSIMEQADAVQSNDAGLPRPPPIPTKVSVTPATQMACTATIEEADFTMPSGPCVAALTGASHPSGTGSSAGPVQKIPSLEKLTFGLGDGRQPAPHYPRRAAKLGQEGAVSIILCVDCSGLVTEAQLSQPCPWPLLNRAALCAIKERWRFCAGSERRYEVTINFQLHKALFK